MPNITVDNEHLIMHIKKYKLQYIIINTMKSQGHLKQTNMKKC